MRRSQTSTTKGVRLPPEILEPIGRKLGVHYFSYLAIGGQYIIPSLSDPLGRGSDLFGTAADQPNVGIVGPWLQWSVAVIAVVVGHVIAVAIAHVTALRFYGGRRMPLVSQIPMLLMVGYTMLSLWILSQPIVETAPAG
jgi:hypothetical protein